MVEHVADCAPAGAADLRGRVLHALGWALTGRFVAQAISWVITLVVIRLLTPEDYGLMALATMVIMFVELVNEFGMGGALIQTLQLNDRQIRQSFGILIVVQGAFAALLVLAALPIASFFSEPRLIPILQVSSLQFVFLAFAIIPEALLMRRLEFRLKAFVDTSGQLVGSLMTLGLALMGYGVWALVWGVIATTAIRTIGFNLMAEFRAWPRFSLKEMRGIVSFGGLLTAERISWFLYSQADNVILGKRFGGEVLGVYSVAVQLAALPMNKLGPVIGQVAFPAFAHVQDRPDEATDYLIKAFRLIGLISFPTMFGLSAVAPWFVPVVLGSQWLGATLPLQLMALSMPLRFISLPLPPFLKGLGYARLSLTNTMIAVVALPAAFLIGSNWGASGMSIAWLVAYPLYFALTVVRAGRVTPVTLRRVLGAIARPALMSTVMYLAVVGVGDALPASLSQPAALPVLIAIGVLTYIGQLLLFDRAGLREAVALFRRR